jgi:hypothetical protein
MIAFLRDNYPDALPRVRLSRTEHSPDGAQGGQREAHSRGRANSAQA